MNNDTYSLPPEWHTQSAVQLTWPHENTDWQPILDEIIDVYLQLVSHISNRQIVVIACHDIDVQNSVFDLLAKNNIEQKNIRTFVAPCNDTWARDHGPITLINKQNENKVLDFTFNAWGGKYQSNADNKITGHLMECDFVNANQYEASELILEGGSIESDGNGTVMTTTRCLLNKNRNATQSKVDIEESLKQTLGVQQVLWLEHGYLAGDDTDAHIDTLARFSPQGIVYVSCNNEQDEHYLELNKMAAELSQFKNVDGKTYKLFPLPMPAAIKNDDSERLPATYANFLIINGAVLVPVYNDEQDQNALDIIAMAFPEHEVIGIDCRAVIEQFGSLHCLTMQLPENLID